jgi:hypothetical protein
MTRRQDDQGTKWPGTKWPGDEMTDSKWPGTKWKGANRRVILSVGSTPRRVCDKKRINTFVAVTWNDWCICIDSNIIELLKRSDGCRVVQAMRHARPGWPDICWFQKKNWLYYVGLVSTGGELCLTKIVKSLCHGGILISDVYIWYNILWLNIE